MTDSDEVFNIQFFLFLKTAMLIDHIECDIIRLENLVELEKLVIFFFKKKKNKKKRIIRTDITPLRYIILLIVRLISYC